MPRKSADAHESTSDLGTDWVSLGRHNYEEGKIFEQRVAELYRLQQYDVEHSREFSGRQIDLFLTRRLGDITIHRVVECKAGAVRAEHIDTFLGKLRTAQVEFPSVLGTIVSDESFSDSVKAQVGALGVQLTLYRDLAASLFDGHKYAQTLLRETESNPRYRRELYVEPFIGYEAVAGDIPAFDAVTEWLTSPDWNHFTLLGDVGTGKSFLSRMVADRLVRRFLRNPIEAPLPILIDLRNADREFSLEGLVLTHLAHSGISGVPFEVFQF
jgi:hypothetical protein